MSNVHSGMLLSAAGFTANCTVENTAKLPGGAGIICNSGDAWISNCVVIDYETAFKTYTGFMKQCTAKWTTTEGFTHHTAFDANGKLNTRIIGCRAEFIDNSIPNYFLRASTGGSGVVISPVFDKTLVEANDMTQTYLQTGSAVIAIAPYKKED